MGENFDYLGEKTLANSFFQMNTEIKGSIKLREKTLAISHQFAKFNVFFHQRFPLNGSEKCDRSGHVRFNLHYRSLL